MPKQGAGKLSKDSSRPEALMAFFTMPTQVGDKLELWVNGVASEAAPDFSGTFGRAAVIVYCETGVRGNFISIRKNTVGPDGTCERLATAQVVTNKFGDPKLAINVKGGRTRWAEVAQDLPEELQVRCGLNVALRNERRAAYLASMKVNPNLAPQPGDVDEKSED